jgi:lipid-A-disaccharide synthase
VTSSPESTRRLRVLILAGEASGDQHAAEVVQELSARQGDIDFWGLGGPALAAQGVRLLAGLDQLAVMGFAEVVGRIGFFWKLEQHLTRALAEGQADLVLAVDYPGFNLRMARRARELGVPVLFYIAPQVWAWKAHRTAHLARDTDRVAVILPFEAPVLERAGVRVDFVGHPLKERPPVSVEQTVQLRQDLGVSDDAPLLALLPGSRAQELARHLDVFVEAARRLQQQWPELVPVLGAAPGVDPALLRATGFAVTQQTRELLHTARAGIVKSGTSTLEAAVAGCPFVCVYRTSALTWALAQRLVKVPHVALANLVAGKRVVPELLQGAATAEGIAAATAPLLDDGPVRETQRTGLKEITDALGGPGAAGRTADLALEILAERVRADEGRGA